MKNQNSTSIRQFALFLCCMFFSIGTNAATFTFNGTTNTDWATATNWDLGTVPSSADLVIIAASKSVVIAVGTNVNVEKISFSAGASLTNYGTLTITPGLNTAGATNGAMYLNGSNTFDNEGTLSITTANQTTVNYGISINGTGNTFTFNGTNSLVGKASTSFFVAGANSSLIIGGAGLTMGDVTGVPAFTPFNITAASTITINSGTTLNLNIGAGRNAFYLANSGSIINNGSIAIAAGSTTSGTALHAINMWQTTAAVFCSFTNNGTLSMSGFEQPTVFGGTNTGSTGYGKFINSGTTTITTKDVANALCLYAGSSLPYVFTNSGTLNLYGYTNAIKLSPNAAGQTFTNTGTINITKGSISSSGTSGTTSTYPTLNNNSGGVINFNYGVSSGSTAGTSTVILNNNTGATINGSCTFAASTLFTAAGSTLSPGDYSGGISGIGTIVLTPSATGTKFPLAGSVLMHIKGKTTPGTDFDKISCTELDVTNASLTVTADYTSYTPAVNDYLTLIYSGTSKTGPFSSASMPRGWLYESVSTNEAAKYYPSAPGAPTIGTATAGNGQVSVSFTAPTSDGGADITLYTVTSNDGITATGTSSPVVVTGLTNETAYTFKVTATNIRGTSVASAASNSVTPSLNTAIVNQNTDKEMITVEGHTINLHGAIGMINVFNSVGGLVLSEKTSNRNIELKSNGIYLIKLETAQGIKVQKVLVN